MKAYTDKTALENYLLIEIDNSFDTQVLEWIDAMSDYVDLLTGRTFVLNAEEAEDTVKLYDGSGTNQLLIDDLLSLDEIIITTVDGFSEVVDSDYIVLYPANKTPKTKIILNTGYFPCGHQNISVSALWGYGDSIPSQVKWAVTVLVAGIINNSNSSEGEVQSETIGRYSVTYQTKQQVTDFENAKKIINSYIKYTF